METTVNYLNLEYFLVRLHDVSLGIQGFFGNLPAEVVSFVTGVFILGMAASLLFLILVVYAQIQLLHTEHAGFHEMEEEEHEKQATTAGSVENLERNARFEQIMKLASSANHGDWRRAILEADIMLGDVLSTQGYEGAGVGEQLKMANPIQMTTLDLAWKAHKVRNDIAHQGEAYDLGERDAHVAIDYYKRVFEELGAI